MHGGLTNAEIKPPTFQVLRLLINLLLNGTLKSLMHCTVSRNYTILPHQEWWNVARFAEVQMGKARWLASKPEWRFAGKQCIISSHSPEGAIAPLG